MSALSQIEAAHARHRAGLLAAESAEQRRLVASYAKAIREVEGRLAKLAVEIASATENLDPLDAAEVLRGKRVAQARLEGVLADMRYEVAKWTDSITPEIEALHAEAVRRGVEAAESLTRIGLGTPPPGSEAMIGRAFASVDHGAVEQAVAFSHGGPVRELLDTLAGEAAEEVAQEMTSAIARGQNPLVTASRVRSKLAAPLYRAQTITRTETLRAYREATREAYQQSNLVKSWVWIAACDSRTCGACWALHGKEFPTGEKMGTHPRCRCTMAPNTRSWEELTGLRQPGVQETNLAANITSGPELFDALPDSQKLAILGPSKFAAYQDGAITLDDLVHVEDSAVWGTTRREASLRSILGDDAKVYYPKPGRATPDVTPPTAGIDDGVGGVITEDEIAARIRREFDEEIIRRNPIEDLRADVIERIKRERAATRAAATRAEQELEAARAMGRVFRQQVDSVVSTVATDTRRVQGAIDDAQRHLSEMLDLPRLPDRLEYRGLRGVWGNYTGAIERIRLDPRGQTVDEVTSTFFHEFGHWLDNAFGIGYRDVPGGASSPAAADLLRALGETTTFRELSASLANSTGRSAKFLRYLTSEKEMLARAIEQYFGRGYISGFDADRLYANGLRRFIHADEFDRDIAPLIERWLREEGLLK